MSITKLPGSAIQANTITTTQLTTTVVTQISAGGGPKVKSLIYPDNDTAVSPVGGQIVYITGSGFAANAAIYINGAAVPSQSFISASNISFTTPNLASATYPVYLINPEDGATAILIPGILISGEPAWVTSAGSLSASQDELSAWSYNLSATGDTPITYALAAGNTLPTGVSLAANGLISGTITSPTGNTTTYTFSVVATDAQNQDSTRQFTVTTSTGEGVLFANNVLLIHADGTNNQNNHAFLDSSNNNFTITRNGNATQGSFSPFSQTGWSNLFDGSGDYLTGPNNSAFNFGSGDFCVEMWVYPSDLAFRIYLSSADNSNTQIGYDPGNGPRYLYFYNGVNIFTGQAAGFLANRWNHVALCRSGTTLSLFCNGTRAYTNTSYSSNVSFTTPYIGEYNGLGYPTLGYISNLRFVKGSSVYTPSSSTLTVPTAALTAISGTSLLTCQSNRFIDNSTNAFTITRNGDVSVQAFSPFAPTAAYTTASVGGSAYFDGAGDYLSIADSTAFDLNTTFTVECWFYLAATGNITFFARGGGAGSWSTSNGHEYLLFIEGSLYWMWNNSGSPASISITPPPTNTWNHIAIAYNGTTTRGWLNGASFGSSSSGYTLPTTRNITRVGLGPSSAYPLNGYISSLRVVKGTAVYDPTQSTITVPTSPLTNIANTSLLCNFTNAGIFDQTAKNILETVGDAKVSTAQYKYGTGSIVFDGNGDWIVSPTSAPTSQSYVFGTADFTIECWFRLSSLAASYYVIGGNYNAGASDEWLFQIQNNGSIRFLTSADSTFTAPSPAIAINQWYHVAATRSGTTVRLFLDGTQLRSYTNANSLGSASKKVFWGIQANEYSWPFNGYMDDIRITRGYARYTANFTPPTSAMKDK